MSSVYPLGGKGGIVSDLVDSPFEGRRNLKVATSSAFSAAGESGRAFARTIPITIPANRIYSFQIQRNANVAVRFVRAAGLYIEAVLGDVSGTVVALERLISTNGILINDFASIIELYDGEAVGDVVLGAPDELNESFYPDGNFVVELRNDTAEPVSTFLVVGVQQISETGVYTILEPNTQIEANTEMSIYNGIN